MSATRTVVHTRSNSKPEDHEGPNLDEILNTNKNKSKTDLKAKERAPKATGNKSAGGRSRESAIMLGTVAWDNLFQEETIELPGTVFME